MCSFPMTCVRCARTMTKQCRKSFPTGSGFSRGGIRTGSIRRTSVDKKFAEFWNKTPFANKVDKKPTVQSLRHTFVVNKMNEWMEAGVEIGVMMPYLSRYLGHSSISDTQYYFHAIEQAFPVIRRSDTVAQRVIPEVEIYEE